MMRDQRWACGPPRCKRSRTAAAAVPGCAPWWPAAGRPWPSPPALDTTVFAHRYDRHEIAYPNIKLPPIINPPISLYNPLILGSPFLMRSWFGTQIRGVYHMSYYYCSECDIVPQYNIFFIIIPWHIVGIPILETIYQIYSLTYKILTENLCPNPCNICINIKY